MTERENFLRIAKMAFDSVAHPIFTDNMTKNAKLDEVNRWMKEILEKTKVVEKTLDNYINLGLLKAVEKSDIEQDVRDISTAYFEKYNR